MENLNEFFDLIPTGLKQYGVVDNESIYSNEKIIMSVLAWLEKSSITKPILSGIKKGIDTRSILIGYENKSKLSFLAKRIKSFTGTSHGMHTLGYFSPVDKKLVILLDDNVNILGKAVTEIPSIIAHELCHFAAFDKPQSFISTTLRSHLLPFYKNICYNIAPLTKNISDSVLTKTIQTLIITGDASSQPHTVSDTINIWRSYIEHAYPKEKANPIIIRMALPYLYFINSAKVKSSSYRPLINDTYKRYCVAYSKLGQDACRWTQAGQEFAFPSEIVAITSQWDVPSSVARLINMIDYRKYS